MIDAKRLADELKGAEDGRVTMVETGPDKIIEMGLAAMRLFTERGCRIIVVSATRPYANLLKQYETNGIDTKKVYVIDCVTKGLVDDVEANSSVDYVNSAADLTDISVSLSKAMDLLPGKKAIFVDSITTLLIHNDPQTLVRFLHTIMTKMRLNSISGFLTVIGGQTDRTVVVDIMQLCDKFVKM